MQKINYLEDTTSEVLRVRFTETLKHLKSKYKITLTEFQSFVCEHEPSFKSPDGYKKIRDTWYKYTMNIRVCELINDYETFLNK